VAGSERGSREMEECAEECEAREVLEAVEWRVNILQLGFVKARREVKRGW
jgi:hypothetical protein